MEERQAIDSKFRLVILASKRAKQLLRGSKKKIDTTLMNPLSIALEEIKQGKINFEILTQEGTKDPEPVISFPSEENGISEVILSETESDDESEMGDTIEDDNDSSDRAPQVE